MRRIVNPQQTRLFDPFDAVVTEKTRQRLLDGWSGVFRHVILALLPVDAISGHFDPDMGRPTKELYSMAGLILIMEFMDWTKQEALDGYSFRLDLHYALNLEPVTHDLSRRTLERYLGLFEQNDLAQKIMQEVTTKLVGLLGLKIDQQRLDSTHVFSDMASLGRTRLMGVAIKRFLTQVKRGNPADYEALDESLRERYAPSVPQLFGDTGKDSESRRLLRQQVAEDMYELTSILLKTEGIQSVVRTRPWNVSFTSNAKSRKTRLPSSPRPAETSRRTRPMRMPPTMALKGRATRSSSPRPAIRKTKYSWLRVPYHKPQPSPIRRPPLKYSKT